MSERIENLRIFADAECTQEISTIGWSNSIKIKLADGTEKILPNTARGGDTATTIVWIRNDSPFDYGITEISFDDPRIQLLLSSPWVYPSRPTQLSIIFPVPAVPTKDDIIKAGKINIIGYYIYKS